jgi:hypothetical protein
MALLEQPKCPTSMLTNSLSIFFCNVRIAKYYRFDGWLFNIESDLSPRSKYRDLVAFLSYLTGKIHREIPGSMILWLV